MKEVNIKHIADAFVLIARANHYMVGFVNVATAEQLEQARQVLIAWDNEVDGQDNTIELAIDLIEREIKGAKL